MQDKDKAVFEQMKEAFTKCDLPISTENFKGRLNFSTGRMRCEGLFDHTVVAGYEPDSQYIHILSMLAPLSIPKKKIQDLLVIINALNGSLFGVTIRYYEKMKSLELKTGMHVLKSRFNGNEFQACVHRLMEVGMLFFPVFIEFIKGTIDTDRALKLIR